MTSTGRAVDAGGVATTLNLVSDQPVFTLSGAGDALEGEVVRDVRSGWAM